MAQSWRAALALTASGFNRLTALRRKLLPRSQQPPTTAFRGLGSLPPSSPLARCADAKSQRGFDYGGERYVPWGYSSASMALAWAGTWSSDVLLAIEQQHVSVGCLENFAF